MRLPIGYDDFGKIIEKKLNYVDKSLFIKEILDDVNTEAIVITRPRRFGKTLNVSMLHYFLAAQVRGKDTRDLFHTLKIAKCGQAYMQHQGKYPVILISFKDIKENSFQDAYDSLCTIIQELYRVHRYILFSDKFYDDEKSEYEAILKGNFVSSATLKFSLKRLTQYLYHYYDRKPWLLMDEYDTPIQSGYANGYYDEMIDLMRGLLGAVLKNNPFLEKAVITGILRVAKESLFSGVNNLEVYSLLREEYSAHFGFTEPEVDHILEKYRLSEKSKDIKAWYNGYQFGNTTIYNPWSMANCVKRKGELEPYWVNTSDNQLMKDLMKKTPLRFKEELEELVTGRLIEKLIDEQLSFHYLENNPDALWNLLVMAGYLKPAKVRRTDQGVVAELSIPNREVQNLYRQMIEQWLSNEYGVNGYNEFIAALLAGQMDTFKRHLDHVLLQIVSVHDMAKEPEAFYHGLVLGFTVSLQHTYEIHSNRESGRGRFDIMMIPKDIHQSGIVIELKIKSEHETLEACAQKALHQIQEKKYSETLKQRDIRSILQLGIGFQGKACAVAYVMDSKK